MILSDFISMRLSDLHFLSDCLLKSRARCLPFTFAPTGYTRRSKTSHVSKDTMPFKFLFLTELCNIEVFRNTAARDYVPLAILLYYFLFLILLFFVIFSQTLSDFFCVVILSHFLSVLCSDFFFIYQATLLLDIFTLHTSASG